MNILFPMNNPTLVDVFRCKLEIFDIVEII